MTDHIDSICISCYYRLGIRSIICRLYYSAALCNKPTAVCVCELHLVIIVKFNRNSNFSCKNKLHFWLFCFISAV